jgi:quercetin dioxygenase-like cupin family protein
MMFDAPSAVRAATVRRALGAVATVILGTALWGCSRNEPPAASFAKTEGQVLVRAKAIKWGAAPPGLPAGAKATLLQGNPNAAGRYVIRLQFPANYKIPFHAHPNAMDVTVVSGTLYVASTQTYDKKKAFAIKPGDFYHLPPQASQLLFTKGETVVEIHGDGPYELKYANAADDPLKGAAAPAYSFTESTRDSELISSDPEDTVDMTY